MKGSFFIHAILLFFCLNASAQSYKVMTYNIKLDYPKEGENNWQLRKPFLIEQILFLKPDVLGVQEALLNQMCDLDALLMNYDFIGIGRDDGKKQGEYSAIFYNKNRLHVVQSDTFWLSPTPEKVSKGWDADFPRICTYALFQEKNSETKFWVFNTHFDHVGKEARENSVALILQKIMELNVQNYSVILTGDFNLEPNEKPIQQLANHLNDSKTIAKLSFGVEGTYNGFRYHKPALRRIDYIFVSHNILVDTYATLNTHNNGFYPSDHFPVWAEIYIQLQKK